MTRQRPSTPPTAADLETRDDRQRPTRRAVLGGVAAFGALALAGCRSGDGGEGASSGASSSGGTPSGAQPSPGGDGSWVDSGPQPRQPTLPPLTAGAAPPQFVVVSWDGAADTASRQLSRFLDVADTTSASMTLFLSGLFLLPEARRTDYRPPGRAAGASDIGYLNDESIRRTLVGLRRAWLSGHEIGTHFNGHFCGKTGVGTWTPAQWRQEIDEAMRFVMTWRTATGFTDIEPLPFDYRKELVGSRTPCLEGRDGLLPTAAALGWRYDSSGTRVQTWPTKHPAGLWDLSMPSIPFPGRKGEVIAMDYNFMTVQNGGKTSGPPDKYPLWRDQVVQAYLAGFDRAHGGNRAPYVIGNHFEQWCGGIYMDAVATVMTTLAKRPDTYFVSMRQLCDWLDAQDPDRLARLRKLGVGQAPAKGWATW